MSDREYIVDKIQTKLYPRTFKGVLGQGDSGQTVLVADKANYVYVRVKYGSELGAPVEALNRVVPPIHGRMVRLREIDRAGIKGFEVIGFDDRGAPYYHDDTQQNVLPAHGHTHECNQADFGTDPVNLYTRGWAELRVEPTDPISMYCYVTRGWYLFDVPAWFEGGNTPLFTAPAAARYDVVYLNSSGTINIEQGVEAAPAFIQIPEPPDYTIPLATVYMTGSTGGISEDMILDSRVMPNVKYPPGGTVFDDSITPSAVQAGVGPWAGDDDYASRADHRHNFIEPLRLLDGSADVPSFSFASETTLGFWRRGAAEVGLDDSLWIGNDLYVTDHAHMATGTCTGGFNVGGSLGLAGNECVLVRPDRDGDEDFDPLTSANWDGDSFSTSSGTIDWNAEFGVPIGAKIIFVRVSLRDSGANYGDGRLGLRARSTGDNNSFDVWSLPNDEWMISSGLTPVATNGTSYYTITASGAGTCDIWIRVTAWAE